MIFPENGASPYSPRKESPTAGTLRRRARPGNWYVLERLRKLVRFDVLRRVLVRRGHAVRFVRNLTDVDDKIIARAAQRSVAPEALAEESIRALHREMESLSVLPPDVEPRVTRHIDEIVALVERLVAAGHADGDLLDLRVTQRLSPTR